MWSELGHAYLAAGQVPDAIASYLRSNDSSKYPEVIDACKGKGKGARHGARGGLGETQCVGGKSRRTMERWLAEEPVWGLREWENATL